MRRRSAATTVFEWKTGTRRHLALAGVAHTACGRPLDRMDRIPGEVSFPWHTDYVPTWGKGCDTCRRVLASGGLGFWVTKLGTILTEEDIWALSDEAEQTTYIPHGQNRRNPLIAPGRQPGPDAMHWFPLEEKNV